ncbi:MAG TPA: type II secretion system minor pseudopilin GspI [Pseudomonadales bacterium]|nr:type II secretion system minor pseudopilin GspI [Pseudomonadales bacterium]
MRRALSRGFTLLEIMIALAIFAIVSAALIKNAALTVNQTRIIQDKTIGSWIAENQMAQLRAQPKSADSFPGVGSNTSTVNMGDRDWEVTVDIASTDNKDVRRVTVSVAREDSPDHSVIDLTGFVGRY